jgi:hypothetical protein
MRFILSLKVTNASDAKVAASNDTAIYSCKSKDINVLSEIILMSLLYNVELKATSAPCFEKKQNMSIIDGIMDKTIGTTCFTKKSDSHELDNRFSTWISCSRHR